MFPRVWGRLVVLPSPIWVTSESRLSEKSVEMARRATKCKMIDGITKQRVQVLMDPRYGPYIRVFSFQDSGALRDLFDDEYNVLYWLGPCPDLSVHGGSEYYFGTVADPVKLQALLDSIEL